MQVYFYAYYSPRILFFLISFQLLWISGCVKHRGDPQTYLTAKVELALVEGWKITSIEPNQYPYNFTEDGPPGYKFVIEGKRRKATFYYETSKDEGLAKEIGLYIPAYWIWFMPRKYRGTYREEKMWQRSVEGTMGPFPLYLGKTPDCLVYLYFPDDMAVREPEELTVRRLIRRLSRFLEFPLSEPAEYFLGFGSN